MKRYFFLALLALGSCQSKPTSTSGCPDCDEIVARYAAKATQDSLAEIAANAGPTLDDDALIPPAGYERGLTCTRCNGSGVQDKDYLGEPGYGKGTQCLSCMGKGFNWSKK
jgi:hypothetical protein